jgi:hypothetical protein
MLAAWSIPLEPKSGIFMATTRARTEFRTGSGGVELVATDAMESGFAPLTLKALVFAAVIIKPQHQKHYTNQGAVYHGGGGKFEHGGKYKQKRAEVKLRRVNMGIWPDR